MTKRTDVHCPSKIKPEDYDFVAVEYMKCEGLEDCYAIRHWREVLDAHRKATGATYSRHEHGGNCGLCGNARCVYTCLFLHRPSNTYLRVGFTCCEKLDWGDPAVFRTFRKDIKKARANKAGKAKAQTLLTDAGLERAWELYNATEDELCACGAMDEWTVDGEPRRSRTDHYCTLRDIVDKLIRYGNLSNGQEIYLGKLIGFIDGRKEREAKWAEEKAKADPCPQGRVEIAGTVLKTKLVESYYGDTLKMTVKDDRGFLVYGTIPSSLAIFTTTDDCPYANLDEFLKDTFGHADKERFDTMVLNRAIAHYETLAKDGVESQRGLRRGDKVKFTATVEPSKDDDKFGFYKRPAKAELVA